MNALDRVADLLNRVMGLDAQSIGKPAIARAVEQRLAALQDHVQPRATFESQQSLPSSATLDVYYAQLQDSPIELQQLIETVVVPETWFLRGIESFTTLVRLVRETLVRLPEGRKIKILSMPCSTGEEPYSMATMLNDGGIDLANVQIDAVDISSLSIAAARQAVYGKNAFRGEFGGLQTRYFTVEGSAFRLADEISRCVNFYCGNLLDPQTLPPMESYDFVFCRNVLIYFDRAAQDRAVEILTQALRPHGTLFVGPAETALLGRHPLSSLKVPFAFGFRKTDPARPAMLASREFASPVSGFVQAPPKTGIAALATAAPRVLAFTRRPPVTPALPTSQPAPAASACSTETAEASLQRAFESADKGNLVDAATLIQQHVQVHGASAAAFYLLGLIADANADSAAAGSYYRKVLYLDPTHREALAHLAVLLELDGDRDGARLLVDRAARIGRGGRRPAKSPRGLS